MATSVMTTAGVEVVRHSAVAHDSLSRVSIGWARRNLRRDVGRVVRDLRALYWEQISPAAVTYRGVRLDLRAPWATPQLRDAIYNDYYEAPEHDILSATLRSEDRYLELGAGVGFLTTCACQRVGAERVAVFEADPALAEVARTTARANGFSPSVTNAVLMSEPAAGSVDFFVQDDFWASSLKPDENARRVEVPAASFSETLRRFTPTYLTVDIEGGEVDLLSSSLPGHVRAICLEVHPEVAGVSETRAMLGRLIADGFALDTKLSRDDSVFFER